MAVIKQLERDYPDQLYHDGLDVVTTVDLDWQQAAQRLAQLQLDALNHPTDAGQSPRQRHTTPRWSRSIPTPGRS